jgi:hypothetical protein
MLPTSASTSASAKEDYFLVKLRELEMSIAILSIRKQNEEEKAKIQVEMLLKEQKL